MRGSYFIRGDNDNYESMQNMTTTIVISEDFLAGKKIRERGHRE